MYEIELIRHFTEDTGAKSCFGAMLEAVELQAYTSEVCGSCSGGIVVTGGQCKRCNGFGYRNKKKRRGNRAHELTAQPTGHEVHGRDDYDPAPRAATARGLSRLSMQDQAVLELFYGWLGEQCSSGPYGRLAAVMGVTLPGRQLLDAYPVDTSDSGGGNVGVVFERCTHRARHDKTNEKRNRQWIVEARDAADKLVKGAYRRWVSNRT